MQFENFQEYLSETEIKLIINQQKKFMESSFPLYYYYLPQMMLNGFPFSLNQPPTFDNMISNLSQTNLLDNHNWLGFYCTKKENSSQINHDFKPIQLKAPLRLKELENSQQQPTMSTKRKYEKKKTFDKSQYTPNQKTEQKKSNAAYLNEYRNILPNTIHQVLSYIQRKNKSKTIIQKLIQKYRAQSKVLKFEDQSSADLSSEELSSVRFYAYQNHLKNKLSNYVTLQTFKYLCTNQNIDYESQIFSIQQQKAYNKICRTAILYYLKYEVVCVLMSSKRMQKDKKWQHLKVNRRIQNYIKSGFNDQSQ